MTMRILVKHNIKGMIAFQILMALGVLWILVAYFSSIFSYRLGVIDSVIWIFGSLVVSLLFLRCMLYRVDIEKEGIRLYFIRVCDTVIDANYRDRNGKRVRDKHIEINREEGWVLIRWDDIDEIRVGKKLTEPKCNVILKGGHRVKFFNFVDKKVVEAISRAYEEYKRWQKQGEM